jgi:hypothetical protein
MEEFRRVNATSAAAYPLRAGKLAL